MKQLIDLAKEILTANPETALSGSLSLNLQNFKTRREPGDLDFYIPLGIEPVMIEGMDHDYYSEKQAAQYHDEFYEILPYRHEGKRIDFFRPVDEDVQPLTIEISDGMKLVRFSDIIKMKVEHAYGQHFSKFKHKDDIIFMLSLIS